MRWLLGFVIAIFTVATFWAPGAKSFQQPELARIIFFHLPCAISTPLFFFFAAYLSFRYLRDRNPKWHIRAVAANEVGFVLALCAMASGMLFSAAEWGAWWQWDPRQYSFLIVLLIYGAYFALRISFSNEVQGRRVSAAYSCFAALSAFFLIFVFPRLPGIEADSLHPSNTVVSGGFDRTYSLIVWPLVILVTCLGAWIYRVSVRAGFLEEKIKEHYGQLENSDGHSPVTGVVRPISVSDEGREAGQGR